MLINLSSLFFKGNLQGDTSRKRHWHRTKHSDVVFYLSSSSLSLYLRSLSDRTRKEEMFNKKKALSLKVKVKVRIQRQCTDSLLFPWQEVDCSLSKVSVLLTLNILKHFGNYATAQ